MKISDLSNNRFLVMCAGIALATIFPPSTYLATQQSAAMHYIDVADTGSWPLELDKVIKGKDLSIQIENNKYSAHIPQTWNVYNYSGKSLDTAKFEIEILPEYKSHIYITQISIRDARGRVRELTKENLLPLNNRGTLQVYEIEVGALNPQIGEVTNIHVSYLLDKMPEIWSNDRKPLTLSLSQTAGWSQRVWNSSNSDQRSAFAKWWARYSDIVYLLVPILLLSAAFLPLLRWNDKRTRQRLTEVLGLIPIDIKVELLKDTDFLVSAAMFAGSSKRINSQSVTEFISKFSESKNTNQSK